MASLGRVSTTDTPLRLIAIRDTPLSVAEAVAAVSDSTAGGMGLFVGMVRDSDGVGADSKGVTELEYSAHPQAVAAMEEVARAVLADLPLLGVALVHRTGLLAVGDLAVVVACTSRHRDAALSGTRRLIDDLKAGVPIWKRQVFSDGSQQWVGTP